ncbi:hypothetical protein ABIE35_000521 [Paenarthrobacter sp. 4246]
MDRAALTGKQGMRTFGIEQFELEEFTDSGFGEAGFRATGTDLQLTTSHGALAMREPENLRDQGTLRKRPGRHHRKNLWRSHERLRTRGMLPGSESGMATAEYAIATLAAVGLAGLLVVLLRSEEVRGFLLNLIRTALSLP